MTIAFLLLFMPWLLSVHSDVTQDNLQTTIDYAVHNYYRELEKDNGRKLKERLDRAIMNAQRSSGGYRVSPSENQSLLEDAKSLLIFINCASGGNDDMSSSQFERALTLLSLQKSQLRSYSGATIYTVSFGSPRYTVYFCCAYGSGTNLIECHYTFTVDMLLGKKWITSEMGTGNFMTRPGSYEGFFRYREVTTIKNLRLTSFRTSKYTEK